MDHDAVPLEFPGPSSQRVKDVRDSYRELTHHALEELGQQFRSNPVYESNESGHLAWDVAPAIQAAALAWHATERNSYLAQIALWSQMLLDRTDRARGVSDWRGESGPVWSAGDRYTARSAPISIAGLQGLRLQAIAARARVEMLDSDTTTVHLYAHDGTEWSSPPASLLPESPNYLPDMLAKHAGRYAAMIRGLPDAIALHGLREGEFELTPQIARHFVHTALIARALICAADTLENAGYTKSPASPADLYNAARDALLAHDSDIRVQRGQPWYVTPMDFPGRRLGVQLPHNHVADAATCFLVIGRRSSSPDLEELGRALTQPFIAELKAYQRGALPHPWFYYPHKSDAFTGVTRRVPLCERTVTGVARAEDSSHATMRVRALSDWKRLLPSDISDDLMADVAMSFRRHFMTRTGRIPTLRWTPGDEKDSPRRGYANAYAGAWGRLTPWDSTIKRRINSMAYRHPPTFAFGATALSCAELFALNSGNALKFAIMQQHRT